MILLIYLFFCVIFYIIYVNILEEKIKKKLWYSIIWNAKRKCYMQEYNSINKNCAILHVSKITTM